MKWWREWRAGRLARRKLREIFRTASLLEATSLRPEHAGRCLILEREVEGEEVTRIRFSILRHPRPYPFSRQFHEVLEYYRYTADPPRLVREGSVNLSRMRGGDGEPSGRGPGV
jgi:hypothetical protein